MTRFVCLILLNYHYSLLDTPFRRSEGRYTVKMDMDNSKVTPVQPVEATNLQLGTRITWEGGGVACGEGNETNDPRFGGVQRPIELILGGITLSG